MFLGFTLYMTVGTHGRLVYNNIKKIATIAKVLVSVHRHITVTIWISNELYCWNTSMYKRRSHVPESLLLAEKCSFRKNKYLSCFPYSTTVLSYETCIDNYILDSVILFHLNISLKKVQSVFQILMDLPNLMKILIFL